MNSRSLWKWSLIASLALLPSLNGCVQAASSSANATPPVTIAATETAQPSAPEPAAAPSADTPAVTTTANTSPAETGENSADLASEDDPSQAPATPVTSETAAPTNLSLSEQAREIVKLANAGVEGGVMLAYVTNTVGLFNLGAEEIIYLNDLGVSAEVVTAIMHHDQALRASGAALLAGSSPPANATAPSGAPSAALPADQVAPQPAPTASAYPAEPAPAPSTQVVTETVFYDGLSPYGTWIEVQGYGRCWRPTMVVANPYWQPYFDGGRWVYTDCGWYWMSDYSWGWAPFHYGRWFRHHHFGWCWNPGYVWGPSWVAWRYSDGYCGWAPLPPRVHFTFGIGLTFGGRPLHDHHYFGLHHDHYRFVAWNHFQGRDLHRHGLDARRSEEVYRHATPSVRITGDHRNVVNSGLPVNRVSTATRTQIRPVSVRDTSPSAPRVGRAEQFNPNRRVLEVYRPRAIEAMAPRGSTPDMAGPRNPRPGNTTEPTTPRARPNPTQATAPTRNPGETRPADAPRPGSTGTTIGSRPTGSPTGSAPNRPERPAPERGVTSPATTTPTAGNPGVAQPRPALGRDPTPWSTRSPNPTASTPAPANPSRPAAQPADNPRATSPTSAPRATSPTTVNPPAGSSPRSITTQPRFANPAPSTTPAPRFSSPSLGNTPATAAPQSPAAQSPTAAPAARPSFQTPARTAPAEVPRSAPTPSFSAPQRSFTPAPAPAAPQRSFTPAPAPAPRSTPSPSSGGGNRPTTNPRER